MRESSISRLFSNLKSLIIIDFVLSLTLLVMGILIKTLIGSSRAEYGAILWDYSWVLIIISLIFLIFLTLFTIIIFTIKRKKEVQK